MLDKDISNAIVCCGFCDTPVFMLGNDARSSQKKVDCILESKPIPPQDIPKINQITKCATCEKRWSIQNLYIKEGERLG